LYQKIKIFSTRLSAGTDSRRINASVIGRNTQDAAKIATGGVLRVWMMKEAIEEGNAPEPI
jgi:hypothetical protein